MRKSYEYPVQQLREELRTRAAATADRLSRSVARATSVDPLPCLEYGREISDQADIVSTLGRIQAARGCLERCIGLRRSRVRLDRLGTVDMRIVGPARVRVTVNTFD